MLLKEICTPEVIYCSSEMNISAAARLMRQKHVGDLLVIDDADGDQTPLGMVTDRDIVIEVLGKELEPASILVRDIMRSPVVVAQSNEDVSQAMERMRMHGVRRLPLMGEDQKLIGIVTVDDLVRQLAADANALAELFDRGQRREHCVRR